MRLTFLGKTTQGGGSPTLYETDQDSYLVQGWKVAGQPTTVVEIPAALLAYLRPHTDLAAPLVATGRRWQGDDGECETFFVTGTAVSDEEVLAGLTIPGHESCIEVGRRRKDG